MYHKLKVNASRAAKLPPQEFFAKSVDYVQRRIQNKVKKYRYMHHEQLPSVNLPISETCAGMFDFSEKCLPETAALFQQNAKHVLAHEFALFDSGRMKNEFFDRELAVLDARMDRIHLQSARRLFTMLSPGYQPIDWQCDVKSAYRWSEKTWYRDIAIIARAGADIKVPWETTRMQHLPQLAIAFVTEESNDQQLAYQTEFRNQVLDFVATNPVNFGVNWNCAMEVAIRATNLILAYSFFRSSGASFDPDFEHILSKSLFTHGEFILDNLERTQDFANNHYLANLAGLLFISLFFDRGEIAAEWYDFAYLELLTEIQHQFYSDGTNFEASTTYHKLSLELVYYATLFTIKHSPYFRGTNAADVCESVFGEDYTQQLFHIFEATAHLVKSDGTLPQIGDNDSGHFIQLLPLPSTNATLLLAHGALFFQKPEWMNAVKLSDALKLELVLFYGKQSLDELQKSAIHTGNAVQSIIFPESGWAVLRENDNYCFVSAGKNGQDEFGGHGHNDKLSFVLCWDGKDVVRDPGTYVYTTFPEQRNLFRSTSVHNTVMIDMQEQSRIVFGELFQLRDESQARILRYRIGANLDVLVAEHSGYLRLKNPIVHRRTFLFYKKKNRLKILDSFTGTGDHNFEFVLNPGAEFLDILDIRSNLQWHRAPGEFSPGYSEKRQATVFVASIQAQVPCRFYTELMIKK
ncbi:alginate lyase family protein [candidate division KSB1 bacterium]|nr:alginate lyase family protein [candidate division KSB1 bacterium]